MNCLIDLKEMSLLALEIIRVEVDPYSAGENIGMICLLKSLKVSFRPTKHHPGVEAGSGEGAPRTSEPASEPASERAIVQRLSSLKLTGRLRASKLLYRENKEAIVQRKQRDYLP